MKKILLCFMAAAAMTMLYSCQPKNANECRIHGVVPDEKFEGKRIFLVPFYGEKNANTVDSVEIKDGKFEISLDSVLVYKVMPEDGNLYAALQPIIIVGEPGNVWVSLGIDSHSGGTAQNDTLEQWKILTEAHSRVYNQLRVKASMASEKGDTVLAGNLQKEADSLHFKYSSTTRHMAEGVGKGPLYDFLSRFFR